MQEEPEASIPICPEHQCESLPIGPGEADDIKPRYLVRSAITLVMFPLSWDVIELNGLISVVLAEFGSGGLSVSRALHHTSGRVPARLFRTRRLHWNDAGTAGMLSIDFYVI